MRDATSWLCLAALLGLGACTDDSGGAKSLDDDSDAAKGDGDSEGDGDHEGDGDDESEQGDGDQTVQNGPCGKGTFPAKDYDNSYIFCPSTNPMDACLPFSKAEGYTTLPNLILVHEEPSLEPMACATDVGDLTLAEMPNLTDLSELGNVENIGEFGLTDNPKLTSLSGLDSLQTMVSLHIQNNEILASLAGLPDGLEVESLIIEFSDAVTSLDGLENIAVTESVYINDNANLPQCAADAFVARFPGLKHKFVQNNDGTASCN